MIASGVVEEGARLPTIRQLARDLGVAEGTVARAFRELEREGWIETRRRHGSFARRPQSAPPADLERAVAEAASAFAMRVAQVGADPTRALEVARAALRSLTI